MLWLQQPYGQFWVLVKEERETLTLQEKFKNAHFQTILYIGILTEQGST